jgi:hypothetical protein
MCFFDQCSWNKVHPVLPVAYTCSTCVILYQHPDELDMAAETFSTQSKGRDITSGDFRIVQHILAMFSVLLYERTYMWSIHALLLYVYVRCRFGTMLHFCIMYSSE